MGFKQDCINRNFTRHALKYLDSDKSEQKLNIPFPKTRLILAVLGVAPCLFDYPYFPSLDIKRSNFLYSIVLFAIFVCCFASSANFSKSEYYGADTSDHFLRVVIIVRLLQIMPNILALASWFDTFNYRNTVEKFLKLQIDFQNATGKVLGNRRERMENVLNAFATVVGPIFTILVWLLVPTFRVPMIMSMSVVYGSVTGMLIAIYWTGLSMRLSDAAEDVKEELKQALKRKHVSPSAVHDLRRTWVSMRTVLDSMTSYYFVTASYLLVLFELTILLYQSARSFSCGEPVTAAVGIVGSFWFLGFLGLCCLASHHVEYKMKRVVEEVLPSINLSSYTLGTQREVLMLVLIERTRPAIAPALINKKGFIMVFSNCLKWIVVITQLSQGSENFIL